MDKWKWLQILKTFFTGSQVVKGVAVVVTVATVGTTAYVAIPNIMPKEETQVVVSQANKENTDIIDENTSDETTSNAADNLSENNNDENNDNNADTDKNSKSERDSRDRNKNNQKNKNVKIQNEKTIIANEEELLTIENVLVENTETENIYDVSESEEDSDDNDSDDKKGGTDIKSEYKLVWQDNFNGTELNRADWNVELHEPGWVNAELQEYVDSDENIYLEDGKLVLRPVKTVGEDGKASYTSGRVNTQNKHNFKYGKFEARVKVPEGQGYLPAFWLMAADENVYGQWPRCGEIDIMEVMGQTPNKLHGTIHYGHNSTDGHKESQGTYTLGSGTFSDDFHTFTCEWEPGKITWYVDGIKFHEENDWYTAMSDGTGELTYPAPFDQPFYIILNLAVGGSWVGNPNESTDFENQTYEIDYVKVWQKDKYDENVTRPEEEDVIIRDADDDGNYLINGDFEEAEDLVNADNWQFKTASNGEGSALIAESTTNVDAIEGNSAIIETTNDGDVDYSIQLLQNAVPLKAGGTYELSFDAYATAARSMKVNSKAPDNGWYAYLDKTVALTTEKQTYTYEFSMIHADDANCTVEFNMGNFDSTDTIVIDNVSLKLKEMDDALRESIINPDKSVRADGNYIYNGEFQEGTNYLGYWDISSGANASVTSLEDGRRLKVVVSGNKNVTLTQTNVPVTASADYAMSFDAVVPASGSINVSFDGADYTVPAGTNGSWSQSFTTTADSAKRDIAITFKGAGTYYLDNVRIDEDALIKNGSFNAGFSGYEPYVYASDYASYNVDSMSNDNAAAFDINKTGDQAWYIQLKQNGVDLEKDQWYRLSLDAKSTVGRKLMFAIQKDGTSDNDWTPYSGEEKVDLTSDWKTFELEFQMTNPTDLESVLSISMGAVDGVAVNSKHSVYIDNIVLEKIEAPEMEEVVVGKNMLVNPEFANGGAPWNAAITSPAAGTITMGDGSITYALNNVGTADWNAQLIQMGLQLESGQTYRVSFKAQSTEPRTIKANVMSASYAWYGGTDITLEKDTAQDVSFDVVMNTTDANGGLYVSLGKIDGKDTPASTITLSDFSVVKVGGDTETPDSPDVPETEAGTELITNGDFTNGEEGWSVNINSPAVATADASSGKMIYDISNVGTANWHLQLAQSNLVIEQGETYTVSFTIESSIARQVKWALMEDGNQTGNWGKWYGGNVETLEKDVEKTITTEVTANSDSACGIIQITMAPDSDMALSELVASPVAHTIKIDNVSVIKAGGNSDDETSDDSNEIFDSGMITNGDFTNGDEGWSANINDPAVATADASNGKMIYTISNVGTANWHLQLAQGGMKIEQGETYNVSFTIKSSIARQIKWALMEDGNQTGNWGKWYGGSVETLEQDVEKTITTEVTANSDSDYGMIQITMAPDNDMALTDLVGKTVEHTITIDNVSVIKVSDGTAAQETSLLGLRDVDVEETEVEETTEETVESTEEETTETVATEESVEEETEEESVEEESATEEETTTDTTTEDPAQEPSTEDAIIETKASEEEDADEVTENDEETTSSEAVETE